jgi:hypothetical protein
MPINQSMMSPNPGTIIRSVAVASLGWLVASTALAATPTPRSPVPSRSSPATLAPGKYHDWNRYLDEVVVERSVNLSAVRTIDVSLTAASQLRYPDASQNTHKAVREVAAAAQRPFLKGFTERFRRSGVTVHEGERPARDGLLVRAWITKIDPGSQAARYWGSFSAGSAVVEIAGEIIDEKKRTALIRFRQERRAGWGLLGGGYHALLDRDIKQIGGDVAGLVNAL